MPILPSGNSVHAGTAISHTRDFGAEQGNSVGAGMAAKTCLVTEFAVGQLRASGDGGVVIRILI